MKNLLIFCLLFLIFFRGSWVSAAMMSPPSLKKRLGGWRPPSKTLGFDLQATVEIDLYFPSRFSEVSRKASRFNIPIKYFRFKTPFICFEITVILMI